MRRLRLLGVLAVVATTAACAASVDPSVDGSQANPINQAALGAGAAPRVDQSSIEFFQVEVGDRVFFTTDSTELTQQARSVLDRQAQWLNLNPEKTIVIEGHADERGTREYNIGLGANRAESVRRYLAGRGVQGARMGTVSFGRERPVEVCSSERCWAQNRRAVTVVR